MGLLKKEIPVIMIIPALVLAAVLLTPTYFAIHWYRAYHETQQMYQLAQRQQSISQEARQIQTELREKQVLDLGKEKTAQEKDGWEILEQTPVITHAMGACGEYTYLNCLEGFLDAYDRGARVFEADFSLTSDGYVVLRHDWGWDITTDIQEGIGLSNIPSREEFLSVPIENKYTPLSFRDLLMLMEEYDDICVITDTKYSQPEIADTMLHSMLADAEELNLARLFNRIIIQGYSKDMLLSLKNSYGFSNYIYTLYQEKFYGDDESFRSIVQFCDTNNIGAIAMPVEWWKDSFSEIAGEYGVLCFVHPVDDYEEAKSLINRGVKAVYSDFLMPGDFKLQ